MREQIKCKTREDIVRSFIQVRGYRSLLEIGSRMYDSLGNMPVDRMISVNRDTRLQGAIHETSYDYFYADGRDTTHDIVFIDAVHLCEHVIYDIEQALLHLNPGGVVVIHDCLPDNEETAARIQRAGSWTGDVWRAVAEYFSSSPYLCYTVDTDWGCGVVDTYHEGIDGTVRTRVSRMSLNWGDYMKSRDSLLNVVSTDKFVELLTKELTA